MKHSLLFCLLPLSLHLLAATPEKAPASLSDVRTRGIRYLQACQEPRGSWMGVFGQPALTALAVLGIHGTPDCQASPDLQAAVNRALDYLIANVQPDGSICTPRTPGTTAGGYTVYNTSICLLALATCNRPGDLPHIRRARAYLLGSDAIPTPEQGLPGGGFGYGGKTRSDLNNTAWALDALHATDYLDREPFATTPEAAAKSSLAWNNALQFLSICQNLSDTNQSAWIASAPDADRGGFIYCPQDAMKDKPQPQALRSYGTMTYAGLKSLIYAKVKPDDVRLKSAQEWVLRNYTLEQNPGIGYAGLFYYYHTFAKTMALLGQPTITTPDGTAHDWKAELAAKLAQTQRPDGSWCNERSGRWMESIPQLATAYCLMAMQYLK